MKTSHSKALEKAKGGKTYSFLTKKGFRIDAPGSSTGEAYKIARSKAKHYSKSPAIGKDRPSGTYFKYDKEGLHSNEGPYYQYKRSSFRKGEKH